MFMNSFVYILPHELKNCMLGEQFWLLYMVICIENSWNCCIWVFVFKCGITTDIFILKWKSENWYILFGHQMGLSFFIAVICKWSSSNLSDLDMQCYQTSMNDLFVKNCNAFIVMKRLIMCLLFEYF